LQLEHKFKRLGLAAAQTICTAPGLCAVNWGKVLMQLTIFSRFVVNAMAKLADLRRLFGLCSSRLVLFPVLAVAGFGLAGCAQQPQQQLAHSSEYFPESVYGRASPRVVADGQPIPHGGGTYMVGKPYTIAGKTYYPADKHYAAVGYASWYGDAFHGRRTANGEIYDRDSFSAAHPTMPLPSYARVTNLRNNYSMIVRVNDRGPYAAGRIMDVSRQVADALEFRRVGTAKVKVEYVGPASLAGSDDRKLLATLRNDGGPAQLDGVERAPTMVAESAPVRTASAEPPPLPTPREEAANVPPIPPQRAVAFSGTAPLPPTRPFDLGTIPGAGVPIGRQASLSH
jgi:rare lipoprotein A